MVLYLPRDDGGIVVGMGCEYPLTTWYDLVCHHWTNYLSIDLLRSSDTINWYNHCRQLSWSSIAISSIGMQRQCDTDIVSICTLVLYLKKNTHRRITETKQSRKQYIIHLQHTTTTTTTSKQKGSMISHHHHHIRLSLMRKLLLLQLLQLLFPLD